MDFSGEPFKYRNSASDVRRGFREDKANGERNGRDAKRYEAKDGKVKYIFEEAIVSESKNRFSDASKQYGVSSILVKSGSCVTIETNNKKV